MSGLCCRLAFRGAVRNGDEPGRLALGNRPSVVRPPRPVANQAERNRFHSVPSSLGTAAHPTAEQRRYNSLLRENCLFCNKGIFMGHTAPKTVPVSTPWYAEVTRYQWLVLTIASAGWVFDVYEGQIFNITRYQLLADVLGVAGT